MMMLRSWLLLFLFLGSTTITKTTDGFFLPSFSACKKSTSRFPVPFCDGLPRSFLLLQTQKFSKDSKETDSTTEKEITPLKKAAWYATEAFGKLFGSTTPETSSLTTNKDVKGYDLSLPPLSLQETLTRLKLDNEREYFLTGQMDVLIYDENCEFADPFVRFKGRSRFVQNLANLKSFITKYRARPLNYSQPSPTLVETKFMVKLELNLPWKPVLAWPWGVLCEIDPKTNLITLHKESWDIEAWEGVKQVFRKPTTSVD